MVSEAVEEVLNLVQHATHTFKSMTSDDSDMLAQGASPKRHMPHYENLINSNLIQLDESRVSSARTRDKDVEAGPSGNQQQDWSILWSCFENPLSLLTISGGLPKNMKEMVCNAVSEMRRYYSRKVIDVLIKVTRTSLDAIRKRFIVETDDEAIKPKKPKPLQQKPIFLIHSTLMIPNIAIRPTLEELQEALITAGKNITGVSKGVAQWSSGKEVSFDE